MPTNLKQLSTDVVMLSVEPAYLDSVGYLWWIFNMLQVFAY